MNVIYLCRVSDYQASGNQIDIPKKIAIDFFNVPEANIDLGKNTGVNICHRSNLKKFEIIEIQPATNMRWSTRLNSFLSSNNDPLSKDCLLVFEKLLRSYCVYTISGGDPKYAALIDLFGEGEHHMLLSAVMSGQVVNNHDSMPLQQIYYGAPGTGKSHEIKKLTKGKSVIRTTFHPDSDYSTFVGCYKPTMDEVDSRVVPVVVNSGISLQNPGTFKEERIKYKFVMQAFLKAYLGAWKKLTDAVDENVAPQFLVIEEINRGNCAQIFGDLFQLLDRGDNGFSEYPIEADNDLQKEIKKAFEESKDFKLENDIDVDDVVEDYTSNYDATLSEDIQNGRILLLPPNLYIWATMNTSDQSLFPIDSAFKRRWTWKYMKISNAYKKDETTGEYLKDADGKKIPLDWKIVVKDKDGNAVTINDKESLPWWDFINKINEIIASMTSSADKQLGYFFCKAAKDGTIDEETFVSKVIFYLWNDVFKDYGFEDASLFQYKETADSKETKDLTFPDFYDEDGMHVNTVRLKDFLEKVMKWTKDKEEQR